MVAAVVITLVSERQHQQHSFPEEHMFVDEVRQVGDFSELGSVRHLC